MAAGEDRFLITGGTGFVGRQLCEGLTARGIAHVALSSAVVDLRDPGATADCFAEHARTTHLVHLASYQAAGSFPAEHTGAQLVDNARIHVNVLDAWHRVLPKARLLAIGTSCAYPAGPPPHVEDSYMAGEIHGSVWAYGFTKRLLYTGIRALTTQYCLDGSYLIPATMYGEYDDFDEATAHVCGALIHRFVRARRERAPRVTVWGDGSQVRDFMDVKEFVRVLCALAGRCEREVLNVGPGAGTKIGELAQTIARAAGYEGELFFDTSRYVGVEEKYMSAERLGERYGLRVSNEHAEGLGRTLRWFDEHYDDLCERRKFDR